MLDIDLEIIEWRVREDGINKVETNNHSVAELSLAIKKRASPKE
jgi:hypothetical protein